MLLLENAVTGYPIVHTQVISCWLLILYLLLHAQFLCLLFSYFLAINRGAHNHCCLQRKGVWEINLALKALGKLKISLLVAETMHSLHPVRAVSSHLANYIKGISFKRFLRCNSTLGAQRRVSQRSDLCLLKLRINAYIWIYIYIYICSKQCENLSWLNSLCVSSIYFCQRDPCYTRGIYSQEKAVLVWGGAKFKHPLASVLKSQHFQAVVSHGSYKPRCQDLLPRGQCQRGEVTTDAWSVVMA